MAVITSALPLVVCLLFLRTAAGTCPQFDDLFVEQSLEVCVPTPAPTAVPTLAPTPSPTPVPTMAPTLVPTVAPTVAPTPIPAPIDAGDNDTDTNETKAGMRMLDLDTSNSTEADANETEIATDAPAASPTPAPTAQPTPAPTLAPTLAPTPAPNVGCIICPMLPLMPSSNCSQAPGTVDAGHECTSVAAAMTDGAEPVLSCPAGNRDPATMAEMTGNVTKVAVKVCGIHAMQDINMAAQHYSTSFSFGPAIQEGQINETGIDNYHIFVVNNMMQKVIDQPVATVPAAEQGSASAGTCCDDSFYTVSIEIDLATLVSAYQFMVVPDNLPIGVLSDPIEDAVQETNDDANDDGSDEDASDEANVDESDEASGDNDDDSNSTQAPTPSPTPMTSSLETIAGSFTFELSDDVNITSEQVRTASQNALAFKLSINQSDITVTVTAARRLEQSTLLRKLASSWTVTYSITLPEAEVDSVMLVATAISANSTDFQDALVSEVAAITGTSESEVQDALTLSSFGVPVVQHAEQPGAGADGAYALAPLWTSMFVVVAAAAGFAIDDTLMA